MKGNTLQDIINYTGLKPDFLRKAIKEFEQILKPYTSRGDKNAMLFDNSSLFIFDRIKQLKENDYSIQMIKEKLISELQLNTKTDSETYQNKSQNIQQNTPDSYLYNELKDLHTKLLIAKDETIETQKEQIKILESKILLITDGRTPEQVKQEFINKEIELKLLQNKALELEEKYSKERDKSSENQLQTALKEKEISDHKNKIQFLELDIEKTKNELNSKEKLVSKTEELKKNAELELERHRSELTQLKLKQQEKEDLLKKEDEENKRTLKEKADKKNSILKELSELENKWFVGSRRKQLIEELKNLG